MQKLIYPLWKPATQSSEAFRDNLLQSLGPQLITTGLPQQLRLCVVDEDVAPAANYRISSDDDPADGLITLWLDSYLARAPLEQLIAQHSARYSGYLVWESEPLVGPETALGQRSPGMNQVVFLRRPEQLSPSQWLSIWHQQHTAVAIETQSTTGYRQNVVIEALTDGALTQHAIIEENFPPAALHSRQAFYNAGDNEALYREREQKMIESCSRFIDFSRMDCIPMSEYILLR